MSIFYKSTLDKELSLIHFDNYRITVEDIKRKILIQERLGNLADFYIQLMDPETKEVYTDDKMWVMKNRTVLYARIPVEAKKQGPKRMIGRKGPVSTEKIDSIINNNPLNKQTTQHRGVLPANYVCRKCYRPGHWIYDCPLGRDRMHMKRSSGIPRSFMQRVSGPEVEGAMIMQDGTYGLRRNNDDCFVVRNNRSQSRRSYNPY